jgi:hypothetical protein
MSLAIIAANSSSLRRLLPQKRDLHPLASISCVHSVYQNLSEKVRSVVETNVTAGQSESEEILLLCRAVWFHAKARERSVSIGVEAGIDIIGSYNSPMPYLVECGFGDTWRYRMQAAALWPPQSPL